MHRVALNILYLRPGQVGGGEIYARGLIDGLNEVASGIHFILLLNEDAFPTFAYLANNPKFTRLRFTIPREGNLRHIWEQFRLPMICRQHRIDLLHSLGNIAPLFAPGKKIVTIHDLIHLRSPDAMSWWRRIIFSIMLPLTAWTSDGILAVSEFTYADVEQKLHVPKRKIFLTPEGPGQSWHELAPWSEVKTKYSLPEKFFLSVGMAPHKKNEITVAALHELNRSQPDVQLVMVGNEVSTTDPGIDTQDGVLTLGYVPAEDLATIYSHAVAFICSSEIEGFGLPVLEAMTLGTRVIASGRGSLTEIVGEAGILVEYGNPSALAQAMLNVLQYPEQTTRLLEAGEHHAAKFTWKICAEETAKVYAQILKG